MLNDIVEGAIGIGQEKMQGKESDEKTTFKGGVLRFFVSLIWFLITLAVSIGAFFAMAGQVLSDMMGGESNKLGILAIAASLAVAVITFCVPYLRKKGTLTRWCGIVCLGDAAWWIYLMVTGYGA